MLGQPPPSLSLLQRCALLDGRDVTFKQGNLFRIGQVNGLAAVVAPKATCDLQICSRFRERLSAVRAVEFIGTSFTSLESGTPFDPHCAGRVERKCARNESVLLRVSSAQRNQYSGLRG